MNKKTWDLYAPIYKRAMKADQKIYDFMYGRIPEMVRDKEVLELATGPGLLRQRKAHIRRICALKWLTPWRFPIRRTPLMRS